MKWALHKKKSIGSIAFALFVVTGTYNAIVINSESILSAKDVRFVKRLDEVYGVTKTGYRGAASVQWQKLPRTTLVQSKIPSQFQPRRTAASRSNISNSGQYEISEPTIAAAAIQENLSLNLHEVVNFNKWPNGLPNTQFSGSLSTNNGVIESLSVELPGGEGFSVSVSELAGNVFEYEINNERYSGLLYQVDQSSYMVSLTNGPLEGTRLRFIGSPTEDPQEVMQQQVADNEIEQQSNAGGYMRDVSDKELQQMPIGHETSPDESVENYRAESESLENQQTM